MSSRSLRPSRKVGAAVLSATLGLAGLGLAASPAGADTIDTREEDACGRLAGQTRYGTAGAIADAYDAESPTTTAILASGRDRNFPDALAASGLARELNAPILLTDTDSVPLETRSALADQGIETIVIVGGTDAVSTAVQTELDANYDIRRVAGTDRYKTAEAIAVEEIEVAGVYDGLRTAVIATGTNYPDALAAGPVAYRGDDTNPFPLLLTARDTLPADTVEALEALDIQQVIVVGGTAAVSDAVETQLEATVGNAAIRLAGDNREGTAEDVAQFAVAELGFAPEAVLLADGYLRRPSPDALTGGPLGGLEMAPILLVNNGNSQMLPAITEAFITEHAEAIVQVIALGGTLAVSQDTLEAACEAAGVPVPGNNAAAFDAASVAAGDTLTGTLSGDFASATIAGDCIEGGTTTVDAAADMDTSTGGVQFEVAIAQDATPGACEITVTFLDENGDTIATDTVTVEIAAPGEAATLALTPETAINPEGTDHTVTATLTDADGNPAADGSLVRFEVYGEPQDGFNIGGGSRQARFFETGEVVTAEDGSATFSYTDNESASQEMDPDDQVAEDYIIACIVETASDNCVAEQQSFFGETDYLVVDEITGDPVNTDQDIDAFATKDWEIREAAGVTLTPATDTNVFNDDHTVTATVVDQFGDPLEGETVDFEVYRNVDEPANDPATPLVDESADSGFTTENTGTQTTDVVEDDPTTTGVDESEAAGEATFTYSYAGPTPATDTIVACIDGDADGCATLSLDDPATLTVVEANQTVVLDAGDDFNATAEKNWVEAEATIAALTPAEATNPVGEDHTVTATLVDQFGDALIDAETVTFEVYSVDANGDYTDEATGADVATAVNDQDTADTSDDTTEASFTYTSGEARDDVIVACVDGDADNCASIDLNGNLVLDQDDSNATAEKTWVELIGDEAGEVVAGGTYSGEVIAADEVNDTIDIFTADGRFVRVNYETDDLFRVEGDPATLAEFEAALTEGDEITVVYNTNPDAGQQSTFDITDDTTPAV